MAKDPAEIIPGDLADERDPAAERRRAGDRIRATAAGHLDRWPHARVQRVGLLLVDEHHRSHVQALILDKAGIGLGDDVHDRVANPDDVEARGGRGGSRRHGAPAQM